MSGVQVSIFMLLFLVLRINISVQEYVYQYKNIYISTRIPKRVYEFGNNKIER